MAKIVRKPGPGAANLAAALRQIDGKVGKVGWFKTSHYPDGTPVAYVASVHEYGFPKGGIPPRLGMRATIAAHRPDYQRTAQVMAKRVINGQATGFDALEALGLQAAADVRKRIATVTQPPLKVATVKARLAGKKQGNVVSVTIAKPLVHTKVLLNTLTNTVEDK